MATLSHTKKKKIKKRKAKISIVCFILSLLINPYLSSYMLEVFKSRFQDFGFSIKYFNSLLSLTKDETQLKIFIMLELIVIIIIFLFLTNAEERIGETETVKITDTIEIPVACGKGQHGTSRFQTKEEIKESFYTVVYNPQKAINLSNKNIGLVLGMTNEKINEVISCIEDDINSIIIGSTRSGKTRGLILETIWLRAKAGKSMVISDPKGELFLYSHKYLEDNGYEVIDFDLRQPLKSQRYNYMENIVKAVKEGDIPKAIDLTWDLVSVMVGVPKGEPLWANGESAVIAASILAVALEAPEEYKNMTNAYYFLANMCKSDENGEMPITEYFASLPDIHPAKGIFAVAEISPERTRGSFFGSALATLRHFTNWNIADMTSKSDFDVKEIGKKKTALFIIIPDEKTTLYSLVSLFVNQLYVNLVEVANIFGGRLPVEVDFLMDEFGNFPAIPSFGTMLSVGAGRGIRFTLVIQDYQQLEKHYKEDYENIKGNCQITVYLKTPTPKTLEELSKRTGTYTIQVNSVNNSLSGRNFKSTSYSDSANMQSRALLLPDEVGRIERPYSLVLYSGKYPAVLYAPDLSNYHANSELGLGDKDYNKKIIMERDSARLVRERGKLNLWGIWNNYEPELETVEEENVEHSERISFLN